MKAFPKRINIKPTVFLIYSFKDVMLMGLFALISAVLILSGNVIIGIIILFVSGLLFVPFTEELFYETVLSYLKYIFKKKKKTQDKIKSDLSFKEVLPDGTVSAGGGFYRFINVSHVSFVLGSEEKKENYIKGFAAAVSNINDGWLFKTDITESTDETTKEYIEKIRNAGKGKKELLEGTLTLYESFPSVYPSIYIVIYEKTEAELSSVSAGVSHELMRVGIDSSEVGPNEVNKIIDSFKEYVGDGTEEHYSYIKGKEKFTALEVKDYPAQVKNGYLSSAFSVRGTVSAMRIKAVDKISSVKRIDGALSEIDARLSSAEKQSEKERLNEHRASLINLLSKMGNENETLADTNLIILAKSDAVAAEIKRRLSREGIKVRSCKGYQGEAMEQCFLKRTEIKSPFCINSSVLAASFPFTKLSMPPKGNLIGKCVGRPAFLNIWKRDLSHQNSNGFIVGKSGSGKTYFLKSVILNEWAAGNNVIILDPEGEYTDIIKSLSGTTQDFGGESGGKINPFRIYVKTDEENSFNEHLKTLEEFFNITLKGSSLKTLEEFNGLTLEAYTKKGIDGNTDLNSLKEKDFPVFSDLEEILLEKEGAGKPVSEEVKMQMAKFTKGRYSGIFGGDSGIDLSGGLVSLDFKPLFDNSNSVVATGVMLLVFDMLTGRLLSGSGEKKTVLAVDEAHLFIDPSRPVSLDFFSSVSKRIRKYGGSFIAATQSISDWVSTGEIRAKSSALIKNSQYSFFFKLSPIDTREIASLYGESNFGPAEEKAVLSLGTGEMYFKGSDAEKTIVSVIAGEYAHKLITEGKTDEQ